MTVLCPEDLMVSGDREWLERALANLLENAIRHGGGPVTLTASRVADRIEIHVLDEGNGFPPDFITRAFNRFARAPSSDGSDGAGVGLAIARSIAQAHGGDAGAANRPDGGADVWLSLPAIKLTHAAR